MKRLRDLPTVIPLIIRGLRTGTEVLVTTLSWETRSADFRKDAVQWTIQGAMACGHGRPGLFGLDVAF